MVKENLAKQGFFRSRLWCSYELLYLRKTKYICFFAAQDLFWIKRIVASPDRIPTLNSSFVDVGYISIKQRFSSCLFFLFVILWSYSKNCWFRSLQFFQNHFQDQKGLPKELFAVKMYALTVDTPPKVHRTRSKTSSNRPQIIKWQSCFFFVAKLWSWFN